MNHDPMQNELARAVSLIHSAENIACLTGAGVSVESGLATFRDTRTGAWTNVDPEKYASQKGFVASPGDVWRWYMKRYNEMSRAQPNAGHIALAELEILVPNFTIVTQNVDDLHERAGSRYVLHLHGSICRYRCNGCRRTYDLSVEERSASLPPMCPRCFDFIRPDIVWFEEHLPTGILDMALRMTRECNVMLVAGTSGVVYPAGEFPTTAKQNGAAIIEINPETTAVTGMADVSLRGPSGVILPQIIAQLKKVITQSVAGVQTS